MANNSSTSSQLTAILLMVITGNLTITDEQIQSIIGILTSPVINKSQVPVEPTVKNQESAEIIHGLPELAQLLHVSIPTASKISQSGRFDSARLDFGTKKFHWDKAKVLEIAQSKP